MNSDSKSQIFPHNSRTAFRQVADTMPFTIIEMDLDYTLVYANNYALDTLGMNIELIEYGVHLKEIIASEQFMAAKEGLDLLVEGSPSNPIVLRLKRRDGVEITTETFAELIVDNDVPVGVVSYSIDMTRRIAVEEKVQHQEGAFRTLVEQSNFTGVFVVNDQYRLEYVNDKSCDIIGRTRSELLGVDFREYLHPESIALVSEHYWKRRAGQDVPSVYDFKIIHKDGHPRDVIISSTTMKVDDGVVKTVTQMIDITEERANQQALKESEQKHRTLVDAIDSGFIIDDENGFVLSANQPICDILGYDNPDELIGSNIISWTYGWDESDVTEKINARRAGKSEHYELQLIHKSGKLIPVLIHVSPWHSPAGEYIGSFALINDVSALKQTEAEVRFLLDLLLHDLSNQLQLILAGVDLLETDLPTDQFARARAYIMDGANRCLELITNIRRAEDSKFAPLVSTNVIQVLTSQIHLFGGQYGYHPEITSLPTEVIISADGALGHLFWNLMENSIKHNPTDKKDIWISGEVTGDSFLLSISDNGPGLSPSMKDNLFDPTRRSSGVGLHLVRRLALKYGASLTVGDRVQDSPENGLEIIIKFPILR